MHPHLRTAAAVALLAVTVAACGGSASTASPGATTAPTAAPTTAATASAAPDASASPAASLDASAAPSVPASPAATPTPDQQALMERLPTSVGTLQLKVNPVDGAALIAADPEANKGLVDFLTKIGLEPTDLLIAFTSPESQTSVAFSIGAYRFVEADPAKLKAEFVQANLDSQPGSTAKDETIGGREVVTLGAPAGDSGPPVHLIFDGDTVFVVSSTDADFAAEAVKALPIQ
ncbi:MAG: hypothetical protein MUE82_00140 [Chloroflexi bacterium]|jgi:hypothetical protein|nr:hypothetical protein [Chloroflexota bacterium]